MLKVGIVGLPNVGKSTLFKALTKKQIDCANFPFCTIEPNVGVVEVPDERIDALTKISKSEKTIPTAIEFVDIAGLVKGAHKGEGLGNKFLANIREVDAIVHVVRAFEDTNIVHVDGTIEPARDAETIEIELAMADLESASKHLEKVQAKAKSGIDKDLEREISVGQRLVETLEAGKLANTLEFNEEEKIIVRQFNFLTTKPIIYVVNVAEEDVANPKYSQVLGEGKAVIPLSVKIESEITEMPEDEQKEYLSELGLEKSGLDKLIQSSYEVLDLITFFTSGEQESRAWTIQKGAKAPQAAGVIHTDFERGFIRAEVIAYNDFVKHNGEIGARDAGVLRLEGKDYTVADGDVCHFRFSV